MTTTSGSNVGRRLERGDAVGGLPDDLEVVVQVEEVAHAAADHGMVVDDEDADPGGPRLAVTAGAGRSGRRPRRSRAGRERGRRGRVAGIVRLDRRRGHDPPARRLGPLQDERRAEDRQAADDLDRRQPLVEQQRGQRDPDDRLEQHEDAGPRPADAPDPGQEQDRRDRRREEPGEREQGQDRRIAERVGERRRPVPVTSAMATLQTTVVARTTVIACEAGTVR